MDCNKCRHHNKGHNCFPAHRGTRCRGATEQLEAENAVMKKAIDRLEPIENLMRQRDKLKAELDTANEQIELIEEQCQKNGKSAADKFMEIDKLKADLKAVNKMKWRDFNWGFVFGIVFSIVVWAIMLFIFN